MKTDDDETKDFPHLGICTPDPSGQGLDVGRVPLGCGLIIHENNLKHTAPMMIYKITMKAIYLMCMCGQPRCTLKIRLVLERSGLHPTPQDG